MLPQSALSAHAARGMTRADYDVARRFMDDLGVLVPDLFA
jgi:hypothetical protein